MQQTLLRQNEGTFDASRFLQECNMLLHTVSHLSFDTPFHLSVQLSSINLLL